MRARLRVLSCPTRAKPPVRALSPLFTVFRRYAYSPRDYCVPICLSLLTLSQSRLLLCKSLVSHHWEILIAAVVEAVVILEHRRTVAHVAESAYPTAVCVSNASALGARNYGSAVYELGLFQPG